MSGVSMATRCRCGQPISINAIECRACATRTDLIVTRDALKKAEAERDEAIEALRPFAAIGKRGAQGPVVYERDGAQITVADIDRAAAILSKHPKPKVTT